MRTANQFNQTFDLLSLAEQDTTLKRAGSGWWAGPCPFCGGTDRFTLKQTTSGWRWYCRHCGGDRYHTSLDYIIQRHSWTVTQALRWASSPPICTQMGGVRGGSPSPPINALSMGGVRGGSPRPIAAPLPNNPFNPLSKSADSNPLNPFQKSADSNPLNPFQKSADSNPLNPFQKSADSNPFNPFQKSADSNPLIKSAVWQTRGLAFMETCAAELSTKTGVSALAWLHARGINSETIAHYRLGYNPQDIFEPLTSWGLSASDDSKAQTVWLPRGIVIPCWEDDWLWYLKIRRPVPTKPSKTPTQKYIKVKGSQPGLFGAWNLRGAWLAVLTEGELDCILLDQQAGDLAGVATLGSAADRITRLDLTIWGRWLLSTAHILIAYDLDAPGAKGCRALQSFTERAIHAPLPDLPGVKDITDYHLSGGDLSAWLCRTVEKLNLL